jgi:hypothetical protein
MLHKKNKIIFTAITVLYCSIVSCTKTAVQFGSEGIDGDPNITMIDTFTVDLSTLQIDSFATSSSGQFIVGSHTDPALGYIGAKSYFETSAPALDLRTCSNCVFDSIELHLKISSGYMGDTTVPFTINLHEVTQAMDETEISIGYNVSNVAYNNTPMASQSFYIRPSAKNELHMRLPDAFGENLFRMFKTNSDTVTNNDLFKRYLKGFCLETSTANNALYYFEKSTGDSIIELHYTIAGATPESKSAYLTIATDDHQFNSFSCNKTGTALDLFTPKKEQLINSTATNNFGYLHYNSGLFPKIKFNNLYHIKELHPYVQVLRAELQVKPAAGTYGQGTAYTLPADIEMRLTDDQNSINGTPLYFLYGTETYVQTGSLNIDNLYGENTAYTYDVTSFVNTVISEGVFSKKALIMHPASANALSNDQRLLIGNSKTALAVKLKLYILGL